MNSGHPSEYASSLGSILASFDWSPVTSLGKTLSDAWSAGRHVFLCGNGGSAANAIHIANDLIYGIGKDIGGGMKVTALPANGAIVTCLANDLGFETIFSQQLTVLGSRGDILIALSGSGNSPNILRAIETANVMGIETYAILGYSGGKAKSLAHTAIHFAIDDMQIAEDLQMVVGHMLMKMLSAACPPSPPSPTPGRQPSPNP
jgi:D-sedoheptulose 7-phosphate isomerase